MVFWNMDDFLVIIVVSDFFIKVWNFYTGKLVYIFKVSIILEYVVYRDVILNSLCF